MRFNKIIFLCFLMSTQSIFTQSYTSKFIEPICPDYKKSGSLEEASALGMLLTLGEQKILKLQDFADLASDELTGNYDIVKGERVKIQGYLEDFALSKQEADDLIMSARNIIYKD